MTYTFRNFLSNVRLDLLYIEPTPCANQSTIWSPVTVIIYSEGTNVPINDPAMVERFVPDAKANIKINSSMSANTRQPFWPQCTTRMKAIRWERLMLTWKLNKPFNYLFIQAVVILIFYGEPLLAATSADYLGQHGDVNERHRNSLGFTGLMRVKGLIS